MAVVLVTSTTVRPPSDNPLPNVRESGAWGLPPAALAPWVGLRAAIVREHEAGRGTPCETEPERWWPERFTTVEGMADVAAARQSCGLCRIRAACLAYAVLADERHGVWGGLTPSERRKLDRGPR